MKRHRILGWDFDSRADLIKMYKDISELTEQDRGNYANLINGLKLQFGQNQFEQKLNNLLEIGAKPHSVIAYHNNFLEQIRNSFVIGSYYPALTSSCALGERILNHLILNLRAQFKLTPEYQKVYRKASFDNWDLVIETLTSWSILLPMAKAKFLELKVKRNDSIHFRLDTENNARQHAIESVKLIQDIINEQFTAFGNRPWFITNIPGEIYLKKSWEVDPFIKLVYLPNSLQLGYKHKIESFFPIKINDQFQYEENEISDEEFTNRRNAKDSHQTI
jgi:hypothetical protein